MIYRGYDIRKGNTGYWIYKADAEASDICFPTEEAAQDAIDNWKKVAADLINAEKNVY